MNKKLIRVWDLPTRLFHWLLLTLVVAAFVTGLIGGNLIVWHGWLGVAICGLLAFRLAWGLVGSTYARFAHFVPGPGRIRAYLSGQWRGVGHNPLGALSVLALLAVLIFQVVSGLVSNDDISFTGPLAALVSDEVSARLTGLHRQNMWIIVGLVALHLAAILFYVHAKKDNLVKPMITGVKEVAHADAEPARGGGVLAFVLALAVAAGVVWVATGGLLPPPPPAPVESAPAW